MEKLSRTVLSTCLKCEESTLKHIRTKGERSGKWRKRGTSDNTFTARGSSGGDSHDLSGHSLGAEDVQALVLGVLDELRRDLLDLGDVEGSQGDADLVGLLLHGFFLVHFKNIYLFEKIAICK